MKRKILTFTALLLLVGISSCKKDEAKITPDSNCKITSVTFEGEDKYDLTYDGALVSSLKQVKGSTPFYQEKLFYNSDNLLVRIEYYNSTTNTLMDIDTMTYDSSKRLTSNTSYIIESGKRVFDRKFTFAYNSSNQIISSRDSIQDGASNVDVQIFEYANNRISKETRTTYDGGEFSRKLELNYFYTNTPNTIYSILKQSSLIINGHPLYIDSFDVTDLLVSKIEIKDFNEKDEIIDTYTSNNTYTFEGNNLKTVTIDGDLLLTFDYKCE